MMGRITRLVAVVIAAAFLVACTSENTNQQNLAKLIGGTLKQGVDSQRAGRQPKVVVTPKMLSETTVAALQVNPEIAGGSDFLRRVASRSDSLPGQVEIWKSSDNALIFLRNGVVVGTRGVGADIISADAALTVRALKNRAPASGLREYIVSDGDVTTTRMRFRCTINAVGNEKITVVNQTFDAIHMRETCIGGAVGDLRIENDYWVQANTGLVRKSRQWVGPVSGYFELVLLKS